MDINTYVQKAAMLRQQGYNCCQAAAAALADQTTLTEEQLYQLASGFGLGMGNMEAACGALVGVGMIAGLHCGGRGTGHPRGGSRPGAGADQRQGQLLCRSGV